ncbi:MAG: response regulator, partial [Desulfuromonadaceae bacterium]
MSVTHILLIEDNPGDARRVMEFLQVTGNIQQTTWQPTLTEGLRFLEESTSDLALLDLGLPDHSGLAAVQRLCQTHPKLPVVILTGNQQQQLAEQALQEGAQDFLCKEGLTPQVLECAIRHAIERQRLASELIALNQQIEATNLDLETAQTQVLQGEKLAAIGQLAAGVAHEINNPVGFIHSNLGTLSRYFQRLCEYHTLLDQNQTVDVLRQARRSLKIDHILADAPELIDESLQGTDRIKTIVQNLKNFSR